MNDHLPMQFLYVCCKILRTSQLHGQVLLPNGRTAHSRFKFPFSLQEHSLISRLKINSEEAYYENT